jgi:hypothetical protein
MATRGVRDRDLGWEALKRELRKAKELSGKAGIIGPRAAQERDDGKGGKITNAELGVIHEFGSADGHVPERSFIRASFDKNRTQREDDLEKGVGLVYDRKLKLERAIGLVSAAIAADAVALILEGAGIPPPNAPSTIARKGSSRPLVDHAQMKNAITSAVVRGEKPDT